MVIGGKTPNTGEEISSWNQVAGTFKTLINDEVKKVMATDDKKAIAELENLAKAGMVYMINKDNPAKLDAIFSKDEQKFFQDRIALEQQMYNDVFPLLVEIGALKETDSAQDYVRFFLSGYGKDLLAKPIEMEIDGEKFTFRNIEQAMESMAAYNKMGMKAEGAEIKAKIEERMSSILKEKSDNPAIDYLRIHDPTLRMFSYASQIGRLLQNKTILDNAREFMAEGKKKGTYKNPEAAKFIQGLFPG